MKERLKNIIDKLLEQYSDFFCVKLQILRGNQIKIYLDGDKQFTINDCTHFNKLILQQLNADNFFNDLNYSLEVSSPGINNNLTHWRQYLKNCQRDLNIHLTENQGIVEGKLKEVNEKGIVLQIKAEKQKKDTEQILEIPFSKISHAKLKLKI